MEQLNGFIRDRHQQLVEFLDRLSVSICLTCSVKYTILVFYLLIS